jgi:hypothetical protein
MHMNFVAALGLLAGANDIVDDFEVAHGAWLTCKGVVFGFGSAVFDRRRVGRRAELRRVWETAEERNHRDSNAELAHDAHRSSVALCQESGKFFGRNSCLTKDALQGSDLQTLRTALRNDHHATHRIAELDVASLLPNSGEAYRCQRAKNLSSGRAGERWHLCNLNVDGCDDRTQRLCGGISFKEKLHRFLQVDHRGFNCRPFARDVHIETLGHKLTLFFRYRSEQPHRVKVARTLGSFQRPGRALPCSRQSLVLPIDLAAVPDFDNVNDSQLVIH